MPRTTHRSKSGNKKLYAKRSKKGRFTDIQSYARAHGSDVQRRSAVERARKTTRKAATKKVRRKVKSA